MADVRTITAAVSLAVAGAAVGFAAHGTASPASTPSAAVPGMPPPPPPCKAACAELAKTCPAEGTAVNCEAFLGRYQSTDGGWTCSQPLTGDALKMLELERCGQ